MVTGSFQIFSSITQTVRTHSYQIMEPPPQLADLNMDCYKTKPPTVEEQQRYEYLLFEFGQEERYRDQYYIAGTPTSDTLNGDFNGDGVSESAWFVESRIACDTSTTEEHCKGTILFSDKKIKLLEIEWCPWAAFKNEGDLNDDGKDEIGVKCNWSTSACSGYDVFTYTNEEWIDAIDGCCGTSGSLRESGLVLVEKDPDRKGYVIIRRSADAFEEDNKKMGMPQGFLNHCSCGWCNVVETSVKIK